MAKDNAPTHAEAMLEQVNAIGAALETNRLALDKQYRDLSTNLGGVKDDLGQLRAVADKQTADYAKLFEEQGRLASSLELVKRMAEAPVVEGGKALASADRKNAIELQRRAHIYRHGDDDGFRADLDNLVPLEHLREAWKIMVRFGGVDSRESAIKRLSADQKRAFDMAGSDSALFVPELLGYVQDCNIICSQMIDLYGQVNVGKSQFMYPVIESYGSIGAYTSDAKCDAPFGPEGNITFKQGKTSDFRGVFCFQTKVIREANYDLLGFMQYSALRSYLINRNAALITGDGQDAPLGWLAAKCFGQYKTPLAGSAASFTHVDLRRFISSCPVEYGPVKSVMHQNVFAYLASQTTSFGEFVFGDGDITFAPDKVQDQIRISNCLPDATAGGTKGNAASPFVAGDFLLAAGNWEIAMKAVTKRPLWMEQVIGGSTAWCVKYIFGAEDGGFTACCPAARVLTVG